MMMSDVEASIRKQIALSPKLSKLNREDMLCFAVTGLNEEAGEVAGLLCREAYKSVNMPHEKWLEELGDVLWYLSAALMAKGITFQELWDYNTKKLEARYGELREKECYGQSP